MYFMCVYRYEYNVATAAGVVVIANFTGKLIIEFMSIRL